jgi:hypothetical protein
VAFVRCLILRNIRSKKGQAMLPCPRCDEHLYPIPKFDLGRDDVADCINELRGFHEQFSRRTRKWNTLLGNTGSTRSLSMPQHTPLLNYFSAMPACLRGGVNPSSERPGQRLPCLAQLFHIIDGYQDLSLLIVVENSCVRELGQSVADRYRGQ